MLRQSLLGDQRQRVFDQRHVKSRFHRRPPGRTCIWRTNIFAVDLSQGFFVEHGNSLPIYHFVTALTTFCAASAMESPLMMVRPESANVFRPV